MRTICCTRPDNLGQQLAILQRIELGVRRRGDTGVAHGVKPDDLPAAIVFVFVTLLVLRVSFMSSVKTGVVIKLQAGLVLLLARRCLVRGTNILRGPGRCNPGPCTACAGPALAA